MTKIYCLISWQIWKLPRCIISKVNAIALTFWKLIQWTKNKNLKLDHINLSLSKSKEDPKEDEWIHKYDIKKQTAHIHFADIHIMSDCVSSDSVTWFSLMSNHSSNLSVTWGDNSPYEFTVWM